jgi:hypothetical protein
MSLSNDNDSTVTIDNGRALLSSTFLELCVKVRNSYPSILPAPGEPFKLRRMCEREGIELSNALLGNNSATYLHLETVYESSAEAMAKFNAYQQVFATHSLEPRLDDR